MNTRLLLVSLALALPFIAAPAVRSDSSDEESVIIRDVPHVQQKPDFCGEACAEMFLRKLGKKLDQDDVFDHAGLDPALGRGCYTKELAAALRNIGFRTGPVWHQVTAQHAERQLQSLFRAMHTDLAAGVPSIICMHYDDAPRTTEHFRLVLGYDAQRDEVLYHEPAAAAGAYQRMKRAQLLKLWPLKYQDQRWTVVRLRLEPGDIRAVHQGDGATDADFAQHCQRWRKRVAGDGFHLVVQKPFVVIGDEEPEIVRQRATRTVKWAVDRIKKDYFAKDPQDIINIWLFKDKASYQEHTLQLFGERPSTPYGYYSPRHDALIMNIRTGGGTLVHEIVHPFMAANFPDCPAWFNEGLASLYEQCGDKNGRIWGYTNWRLRGLQAAIKGRGVPSFEWLCKTSTREFYDDDPGTNYAQARYLCHYLQEQGLLDDYYHQFRRAASKDKSGYQTLSRILGDPDMDEFQQQWEKYVSDLRF